MIVPPGRPFLLAALMLGVPAAAPAQDCPAMPLLGHRGAVRAEVSHGGEGTTRFRGEVTGHLTRLVRLGGGYEAKRLSHVDRLTHTGRLALSAPLAAGAVHLCPEIGTGYGRLATDKWSTSGRVITREAWVGGSVGGSVLLRGAQFTPFMTPVLLRRAVDWRSVDPGAWRVAGSEASLDMHVWLGLSMTTSRQAVMARFRTASGSSPREAAIGVLTTFGRR